MNTRNKCSLQKGHFPPPPPIHRTQERNGTPSETGQTCRKRICRLATKRVQNCWSR